VRVFYGADTKNWSGVQQRAILLEVDEIGLPDEVGHITLSGDTVGNV
jgi:hypothetical protein